MNVGGDIPTNPCFQCSRIFHPSTVVVPSDDQTFSRVEPHWEDPYPSTRAHYTPHA